MLTLTIPWPPRALSPNSRGHWSKRHRAAQSYRKTALWLTAQQDIRQLAGVTPLAMSLEFCPPDRRRRDDDNMLAAFKAARDGIADALGVDDQSMRIAGIRVCEPVRGGQVTVTITRGET